MSCQKFSVSLQHNIKFMKQFDNHIQIEEAHILKDVRLFLMLLLSCSLMREPWAGGNRRGSVTSRLHCGDYFTSTSSMNLPLVSKLSNFTSVSFLKKRKPPFLAMRVW